MPPVTATVDTVYVTVLSTSSSPASSTAVMSPAADTEVEPAVTPMVAAPGTSTSAHSPVYVVPMVVENENSASISALVPTAGRLVSSEKRSVIVSPLPGPAWLPPIGTLCLCKQR